MNHLAIEPLGNIAPLAAVPASELAPGLRGLVTEGVVRHGEALALARDADHVEAPRSGVPDLTAGECATSSFHLDDAVPVHVGSLADAEPVINEADQVVMPRHGLGFALEVVRLVRALPGPIAVRCIVGANSTNEHSGSTALDAASRG